MSNGEKCQEKADKLLSESKFSEIRCMLTEPSSKGMPTPANPLSVFMISLCL